MNTPLEGQEQRKDGFVWASVFLILTAVIVGNLLYEISY